MPTASTIYEVPLLLEESGLGDLIVEKFGLKTSTNTISEWRRLVVALKACPQPVMDQETAVLKALQSAQGFRIRAGALTILCADGKVLIFVPVG